LPNRWRFNRAAERSQQATLDHWEKQRVHEIELEAQRQKQATLEQELERRQGHDHDKDLSL